jgi:hypothetical protein
MHSLRLVAGKAHLKAGEELSNGHGPRHNLVEPCLPGFFMEKLIGIGGHEEHGRARQYPVLLDRTSQFHRFVIRDTFTHDESVRETLVHEVQCFFAALRGEQFVAQPPDYP